jgi:hypothetical protein
MRKFIYSGGLIMQKQRRRDITQKEALRLMQRGSRLMHSHSPGGRSWFLCPGGSSKDDVAAFLREHPSVVGLEDSLFPGLSQTWRMVAFVE